MTDWYTRPVFFVADAERARAFYVDQLGFTETWRHAEDGELLVVQLARVACEIILSSQWPEKNGRGMVFVSLSEAAFAALRPALEAKGVAVRDGWWGYPCLIVDDPDGNQLYFPQPGSGS
ncbi:MAG: glyoxalase superfamily protein [Pseudomonadota bacterium]